MVEKIQILGDSVPSHLYLDYLLRPRADAADGDGVGTRAAARADAQWGSDGSSCLPEEEAALQLHRGRESKPNYHLLKIADFFQRRQSRLEVPWVEVKAIHVSELQTEGPLFVGKYFMRPFEIRLSASTRRSTRR